MVDAMELEALRRVTEELIPFNRFLGMRVVVLEPGRVVLELPFREEFVGDPVKRSLHGGILSTLADTAGGIAIWGTLEDPEHRLSTVDLRVDYLRPGRPETLVAEAVVARRGRTIGVADVRLYHHSAPSETVATGKAVFAIKTWKRSPAPGA
jgi:uncharacterized protein (TIGR00369 family)